MELAVGEAQLLGTLVVVKLPKGNASLIPTCFNLIGKVEHAYSRFLDDSELSKLNSKLKTWQKATSEFIDLLKQAQEFNEETDGNFDATLKSVLDNLGYDKEYSFTPKETKAEESPQEPGFIIDPISNEVMLNRQVDFGGFGKGFALDVVARFLDEKNVDHYYINAGGDIYAKKAEGEGPWTILLEHPDDSGKAIGSIELDGKSIAGSAPNRRKWAGGLHHLINSKTKRPATGAKAIFVLAKTGIEADAYATAIFTAGFDEGIELSKKLPVEVLFISDEGKMYQTPGFNATLL